MTKNVGLICLVIFALVMVATGIKVCMLVGIDPRANYLIGSLFTSGGIGLLISAWYLR